MGLVSPRLHDGKSLCQCKIPTIPLGDPKLAIIIKMPPAITWSEYSFELTVESILKRKGKGDQTEKYPQIWFVSNQYRFILFFSMKQKKIIWIE